MNADAFNARYPVGTLVFTYPGARPEDFPKATRLVTRTRSKASVLGGHTDVVWVEDHSACIALSHVDVVSEDEWKAAKLADAVAEQGALPMPTGPAPTVGELLERIAYLERKVASLKALQDQDDAEYAEAIGQRDRYRVAWQSARDRAQAYGESILRHVADRDAWKGWCQEAQARAAELEALKPAAIQTCRTCRAGYTYGQPCANCEFRKRMAIETERTPSTAEEASS